MNRADVCRELYNAAEFHLFGAGSWPADRESSGAFWKLLNDFGLTANVPDEPGATQYTPLGLELNVELGSGLIKSTIQGLRRGRQRPDSFVPAYRSALRCA
jgi:hypothetical protein